MGALALIRQPRPYAAVSSRTYSLQPRLSLALVAKTMPIDPEVLTACQLAALLRAVWMDASVRVRMCVCVCV